MQWLLLEPNNLLAISISLILTLGLTYLFYPAIVDHSNDLQHLAPHILMQSSSKKPPLLSIVVPAYNEQDRLPNMLQKACQYLNDPTKPCPAILDFQKAASTTDSHIEWIIVNDGSTDATSQVLETFVNKLPNNNTMTWKCIELVENSGKGAAVQAGMLHAQGHYALMVDADGATNFGSGLEALTARLLQTKAPILFGSRANVLKADRSVVRQLMMTTFHACVVVLVGASDIQDTQCGFKLFHKHVIPQLFGQLHLRRWAFDTEVIYLAQQHYKLDIQEVMVDWHEVEGSKLHTSAWNLLMVAIGMFRDMVCIRVCYTLGIWKSSET